VANLMLGGNAIEDAPGVDVDVEAMFDFEKALAGVSHKPNFTQYGHN
jgi:hypothetical protein